MRSLTEAEADRIRKKAEGMSADAPEAERESLTQGTFDLLAAAYLNFEELTSEYEKALHEVLVTHDPANNALVNKVVPEHVKKLRDVMQEAINLMTSFRSPGANHLTGDVILNVLTTAWVAVAELDKLRLQHLPSLRAAVA